MFVCTFSISCCLFVVAAASAIFKIAPVDRCVRAPRMNFHWFAQIFALNWQWMQEQFYCQIVVNEEKNEIQFDKFTSSTLFQMLNGPKAVCHRNAFAFCLFWLHALALCFRFSLSLSLFLKHTHEKIYEKSELIGS